MAQIDTISQQYPPIYDKPPRASFLTLARETRKTIYELALIAPRPIIVWSGMPKSELDTWHWNKGILHHIDYIINLSQADEDAMFTETQKVKSLAYNLLLSHPLISQEAAPIYYHQNTFCFTGNFRWSILLLWLHNIGVQNRASLTKLHICLARPQYVWQLPDGARTQVDTRLGAFWKDSNMREQVYPRNRFLYLAQDTGFRDAKEEKCLEGFVQNISPDVEKVFSLLGTARDGPPLEISMIMAMGVAFIDLPYAHEWDISEESDSSWLRTDLQKVVEAYRKLYCGAGKKVKVLWKGAMGENLFVRYIENGKMGWKVKEKKMFVAECPCCDGPSRLVIVMEWENGKGKGQMRPDAPVLEYYQKHLRDG